MYSLSFMYNGNSVFYCISRVGALLTPITHDTPTLLQARFNPKSLLLLILHLERSSVTLIPLAHDTYIPGEERFLYLWIGAVIWPLAEGIGSTSPFLQIKWLETFQFVWTCPRLHLCDSGLWRWCQMQWQVMTLPFWLSAWISARHWPTRGSHSASP